MSFSEGDAARVPLPHQDDGFTARSCTNPGQLQPRDCWSPGRGTSAAQPVQRAVRGLSGCLCRWDPPVRAGGAGEVSCSPAYLYVAPLSSG